MVKQTFENLSEEKKKNIIETAIYEFALFDYNTASLSRIVKTAGIAKGSMYQYFDNKADLYLYLLDYISNKKIKFINSYINPQEDDFFKLYKEIILTACRFDLENPSYSRMMYNAGRESYQEEIGDASEKLLKGSAEYLSVLIEQAQKKGQIRKDMDIDLLAFIISNLSVDIGNYIMKKFNFSYIDAIKNGKGTLPISIENLSSVLDDLVSFYKTGLQPNPASAH